VERRFASSLLDFIFVVSFCILGRVIRGFKSRSVSYLTLVSMAATLSLLLLTSCFLLLTSFSFCFAGVLIPAYFVLISAYFASTSAYFVFIQLSLLLLPCCAVIRRVPCQDGRRSWRLPYGRSIRRAGIWESAVRWRPRRNVRRTPSSVHFSVLRAFASFFCVPQS
jgi:hypothetical protein